jgi:hypothetical protein
MTSNVAQNYPYSSESEADRAATIDRLVSEREDLQATIDAGATPLDGQDRWWVYKCPTRGCPGLLHAAGYAADKHAVFVVCDGTCGKTYLR